MGRKLRRIPLNVLINGKLVGKLVKATTGAIEFTYDEEWLGWENCFPVSLSLKLRETAYKGEEVAAVFENLLPDNDALKQRVAERVGARSTGAYDLLSKIGHDCVGAFQFLTNEAMEETDITPGLSEGRPIDELEIEAIIKDLSRAPLGMGEDDSFRISIAGAQEKTALLWKDDRWHKPIGTSATTHILKKQIGQLPNGIDLSNSIENEFYCLKLLEAFGLEVNKVEIKKFGETKALVVERFDRRWTKDGRLLRIPQEDCCQALSVPPTLKYQDQGGPGITDIVALLKGSDEPEKDIKAFFQSQILFWLIGATDGHAKNFSVFNGIGGGYRLTPLYDVMTAQPSADAEAINRKQFRLAMCVGDKNRYRFDEIVGRHLLQSADKAGISAVLAEEAVREILESTDGAMKALEKSLPKNFPEEIHASVSAALKVRLSSLDIG